MDEKTQAILKIFLRFPSIMGLPEAEKQGMTAAYLDDCHDLTANEITAGYERYRRKGSPFPPSGPELRAAAFEARADKLAKKYTGTYRLPPSHFSPRGIDAVPEAERAATKARIAELMASLRAGAVQ